MALLPPEESGNFHLLATMHNTDDTVKNATIVVLSADMPVASIMRWTDIDSLRVNGVDGTYTIWRRPE